MIDDRERARRYLQSNPNADVPELAGALGIAPPQAADLLDKEQPGTPNFEDPDDDGTSEGPSTPPETSDASSVIQYTTAVTTIPDATGSVVTSAVAPGAFQVGHAASRAKNPSSTGDETADTRKQTIGLDGDYAIVCGNTSTAGDFDVELDWLEDW